MFGQWLVAGAGLVLLLGCLWLLGTLQTRIPQAGSAVLVGVMVLFGLCIFSAIQVLGQFVDIGAFGS
jgi:phosphate/sulfate permease